MLGMAMKDGDWIFLRITGLKCCYTCESYRRRICEVMGTVEGFMKKIRRGYSRMDWIERIGSDCEEWV